MNGVVVIDKEPGFTSFDVVAVVRRILHEKKIGHTGTLDPMATGVLPVLVGSAAKAQVFLPDTDKEYIASFRLGVTTDTLDSSGKVLSQSEKAVPKEALEAVLTRFRGTIEQVVPMYSAVSQNGVRLYELARKGLTVERPSRTVEISSLTLLSYDPDTRTGAIRVACSKGTYIRSLCDDIGAALGCGGIMTALRRTRACGFSEEQAIPLREVEKRAAQAPAQDLLFPTDKLFAPYPALTISEGQAFRFQNGGALSLDRLKQTDALAEGQLVRLYHPGGTFLGLGRVSSAEGAILFQKKFT